MMKDSAFGLDVAVLLNEWKPNLQGKGLVAHEKYCLVKAVMRKLDFLLGQLEASGASLMTALKGATASADRLPRYSSMLGGAAWWGLRGFSRLQNSEVWDAHDFFSLDFQYGKGTQWFSAWILMHSSHFLHMWRQFKWSGLVYCKNLTVKPLLLFLLSCLQVMFLLFIFVLL